MKTLFVALMIILLNSVPAAAGALDGQRADNKQKASLSELKHLFKSDRQKPASKGSVIAIVQIDENGYGTVIEIDSDNKELLAYVAEKVERQHFQNLSNETIKLVVDFRNQ